MGVGEVGVLCVGGAVISSLECVRGRFSLDGGVKSEETLTLSVNPLHDYKRLMRLQKVRGLD